MQEERIDENKDTKMDEESSEVDSFLNTYAKMHTPWKRRYAKPNRNDVCPFCDSGKKFKNCECYEKFKTVPIYTINY